MNISDLLGAVMQSGMSPSSGDRMKNAFGGGGGGGLLESLSGMLGGQPQQGGGLGSLLSQALGGGGGSGGLGGILGNVLNDAGNAVGGRQNLALGGLGALAGALLGGGGKSLGGALGGGVMALLGAMAYQAYKGGGSSQPTEVPLGLVEPRSEAERMELEKDAEVVLKAMINAAKSDGQIDRGEIQRIIGKLKETGMDPDAQEYVMAEMQKKMDTPALIAAANGRPTLAAQIYGASLLAIEVDTPAEKKYLDELAAGMGLDPEVARRIKGMVGLQA
jgi:uncharacterized membrane protein YebE (DUF533 family)